MVKLGALIWAFFVTVWGYIQIVFYSFVTSGNATFDNFLQVVSIGNSCTNGLAVSSNIAFSLGVMLVLGSEFYKGKLLLKIGGGIMILGVLNIMFAYITGNPYELLFIMGSFLMVFGVILYFVGCIQFRKNNNVAIITGFLLLIAVLCAQFVGLIFSFSGERSNYIWIQIHFITLIVQTVIFTLYSWVLGLSKEIVDYSDEVEDTLSVENGQAFVSYISDDVNKKMVKGKKPSESDEINFTF